MYMCVPYFFSFLVHLFELFAFALNFVFVSSFSSSKMNYINYTIFLPLCFIIVYNYYTAFQCVYSIILPFYCLIPFLISSSGPLFCVLDLRQGLHLLHDIFGTALQHAPKRSLGWAELLASGMEQ